MLAKPATVFSVIIVLLALLHTVDASSDKPLFGGAVELSDADTNLPANPASATSIAEKQIASLIFPRLLEFGEKGGLKSGIVETWREAPDRLSVTLTLHAGYSSTGPYVTSEDLAVSLTKMLRNSPETATSYIFRSVNGVEEFLAGTADVISGFNIVDERTITFTFKEPQPIFLYALADINAAPTRYSIKPENIASSRGPFVKNESSKNSFAANVNYYQGRPFLDFILLGHGSKPDASWRRKDIITIDLETIPGEPVADDSASLPYPGERCVYLVINPESSRMATREVRTKLISAINIDAMVKIFFGDRAKRLPLLVQESALSLEGLVTIDKPQPSTQQTSTKITLCFPNNNPDLKLVAERIKVELLVAGIEVELIACIPGKIDDCDLFLYQALIFDYAPEISLWSLLVDLADLTGSDDWMIMPKGDSLEWMLDVHARIQNDFLIVPLYSFIPHITFDHRLKDVSFRFDGTLNLESAWITSSGD